MSRGPGKVERAVAHAVRHSSRALGRVYVEIEDVVGDACGVSLGAKPKRAQRVAIARAMGSFVRKYTVYGLVGGRGTTPLRIVRLDEPDPGLPNWAAQRSG